jgi:hypothetical protein
MTAVGQYGRRGSLGIPRALFFVYRVAAAQAEPSVRTLLGAVTRGRPVMAEPEGTMAVAAAGRGHLRVSHADREHVIGALKIAFAAGLLAKDEFDRRVDRTLASRTYADLAAITAGITAGPCGSKPSQLLTRAENVVAWGVCGLVVSAVLTVVVIPAGTTKGVVVGTAAAIYTVSWLLAAIMMVATRHRGSRPTRGTT